MIRTQVQLTEAQAHSVRRIAGDRNVSMAEVIRDAVDRYVAQGRDNDHRRRVLAAVGGFNSGHTNVSDQHDDHLTDAFSQ